ncbi:MAG: hypothetical protein DRH06_05750 [Deltaproteobacteria bacterium]|nr:MAG: hypothetical protein DRH06_05750 [Deltaproteobacteria bacterium]
MAGLGSVVTLIYLVIILALLMLGILLPVFVFRIYQESIKTNRKLDQLADLMRRQQNLSLGSTQEQEPIQRPEGFGEPIDTSGDGEFVKIPGKKHL